MSIQLIKPTVLKPQYTQKEVTGNAIAQKVALPTAALGAIGAFGPVSVTVILLPALIAGLQIGLSRGLNPRRLPKMKEGMKCYMLHPQAKHKHNVTMDNFPYEKKLKIADGINRCIHKLGGALDYVAARENFYRTLHYEMQECEREYYKLLMEDAVKEAWFKFHYEENSQEALNALLSVEQEILDLGEVIYKLPSKEHVALKALIYEKLEDSKAFQEQFEFTHCTFFKNEISKQDQVNAIDIFNRLGFQDSFLISDINELDTVDILYLLSKEFLRKLDEPSFFSQKNADALKSSFLKNQAGAEYATAFITSLQKNLDLVKKHDKLAELPMVFKSLSLNNQSNLDDPALLRTLYLDCIHSIPTFSNQALIFEYIENTITAYISFEFFKKLQSKEEIQKLIHPLSQEVDANQKLTSFDLGTKSLENKMVYLVDSSSQDINESKKFLEAIVSETKNAKLYACYCCFDKLRKADAGFTTHNQALALSELLKQQVLKSILQDKKNKVLLICHKRALGVIEEVFGNLTESTKMQLQLVVISPSVTSKSLDKVIKYYQSPYDAVSKLIFNSDIKNLVEIKPNYWDRMSKINPSKLNHPSHFKKIIELINYFNTN